MFAKNRKELASVYQTLEAGEKLVQGGNNIVFERKGLTPKYDVDVATIGADGNLIRVVQLKYLESLNNFAKQTNKAAGQLVNAPGTEKVVEVKIDEGTYQEFKDLGKEDTLLDSTKDKYPDIEIKIEFSDGITKIY